MDRRGFFKTVTGFVAGLLFAPKVLAKRPCIADTEYEESFVYHGYLFKCRQWKTDTYIMKLEKNGDIVAFINDSMDFDSHGMRNIACDSMIKKIERWEKQRYEPQKFLQKNNGFCRRGMRGVCAEG